jgi:hypothetical protein
MGCIVLMLQLFIDYFQFQLSFRLRNGNERSGTTNRCGYLQFWKVPIWVGEYDDNVWIISFLRMLVEVGLSFGSLSER